jgi:CRISPR-associated protein (TIGR03984 family)
MVSTSTQQITLHGRTSLDITLPDVLQECSEALKNGVALLYSPTRCQFGKLQDGILQNSQGEVIALDYVSSHIFEARIFNKDSELRWLNEVDGNGQAVLISEQNISDYLRDSVLDLTTDLDSISQTYLLWGEGVKTKVDLSLGWSRLASARIGALDVPVDQPIPHGKRVYLKTCEYLAEVDECGNVAVVEERLMALEVES